MNHDDLDRLLRDYGEHWRSRQAETSTAPLIAATRSLKRRRGRWIAPALAAAAAVVVTVVVVGLYFGHHPPQVYSQRGPAIGSPAGGAGAGSAEVPSSSGPGSPSSSSPFSRPVHAHRLAATSGPNLLPVGAPVPAREVAHPVRLHGRTFVGLGARGALLQTVYPVRSTDAGNHWQISGPRMYLAAAEGAMAANRIGVLPDGTAYVWGSGGSFIRVAQDGKPPWYAANLPALTRVWNHGNTLLARPFPEPNTPRVFRSTDDGHTWKAR